MKYAAVVLVALLLAGCDENDRFRPEMRLPPLPADLVACLNQHGVTLPRRALTVGDVERFWKTDRRAIVVQRQCGARLIAFYEHLRREWR